MGCSARQKQESVHTFDSSNAAEPQTFSINNKFKAPTSTSQPLPIATKLQRKNQAQSAAKKAQKDAEEADRLRRLAEHRRGLERCVHPSTLQLLTMSQ